jgi:hypothetical protein
MRWYVANGFLIAWLLTILVGTGYVVFILGHSGWWWVLAIFLMAIGNRDEQT